MVKPKFRLEVSYSESTGKLVGAYLRIREGKVAQTKEISDGVAFADFGADGFLVGVELLAPCSVTIFHRLAEKEPEPVRQFLRETVQHPLFVA